ncbi:MAG TPA: ArgP/LysG family DNA-binding transcriptional regulator, partial [Spirochaetales bacterium]|nr:ArgP/LysG family DNA-binding transcriptional regulator [Spirochaetales bacterium]
MLEYRLLQAFASVIERGGFERAAHALSITQSAVSQRIRQLELELGEVLVVRENPPRATVVGERILRHWRQVRDLEDELATDLSPVDEGSYRQLSIGVHTDSLSAWLMHALIPFLRSRRLTVEILQDDQDRVLGFLKDGTASACVSPQAEAVQGCTVSLLGTLPYKLVASP